jgi:hypothetical protein
MLNEFRMYFVIIVTFTIHTLSASDAMMRLHPGEFDQIHEEYRAGLDIPQ